MKRARLFYIVKCVVLCSMMVVLTGTSYLIPLIGTAEVTTVAVAGGLPSQERPEPFNITDPKEKAVILKITDWLNKSVAVDGPTHFGRHGYPNVLEFKLTNNRMIVVEPAYRCEQKSNKDGSILRQCGPVKGEIVVTTPNYKRERYKSPLLYNWLLNGWTQEDRRNSNKPKETLIEKDWEEKRSYASQLGAQIRVAAEEGKLPGFAGTYMDSTTGKLLVGLVEGHDATRQTILSMVDEPDRIRFFDARFTEEELKLQMNRLHAELPSLQKKGFKFNDFGVSIQNNRLEVNVPDKLDKNMKLLCQVVDPKYILMKETMPFMYMMGNTRAYV